MNTDCTIGHRKRARKWGPSRTCFAPRGAERIAAAIAVETHSPSSDGSARLLLAGTVGALIALSLGIYGSVHDPASDLAITLGFTNTITMKVWLATIAVLFAVVQLVSALWMYGRLPVLVLAGEPVGDGNPDAASLATDADFDHLRLLTDELSETADDLRARERAFEGPHQHRSGPGLVAQFGAAPSERLRRGVRPVRRDICDARDRGLATRVPCAAS